MKPVLLPLLLLIGGCSSISNTPIVDQEQLDYDHRVAELNAIYQRGVKEANRIAMTDGEYPSSVVNYAATSCLYWLDSREDRFVSCVKREMRHISGIEDK